MHLQHMVLVHTLLEWWLARPLHGQRSVLKYSVPDFGPRPCDSWSFVGEHGCCEWKGRFVQQKPEDAFYKLVEE